MELSRLLISRDLQLLLIWLLLSLTIIESQCDCQIHERKEPLCGYRSRHWRSVVYGSYPSGVWGDSMYDVFGGYYQNAQATSDFSDPDWRYTANKNTAQNPVAALEQKDDRANSNDFVGNVEVDYKFHFLPDLRLHASVGGEYADGTQTTVYSPYSFAYNYYGNTSAVSEYKYNLSYNVYAQYVKTLGAHTIDVMAGGEEQHFHRNGFTVGNGWDSYTNKVHDAVLKEQTAYSTRNTLVSYFGRLNYSLLDRYLFTFTMRWDGSSRLPTETAGVRSPRWLWPGR